MEGTSWTQRKTNEDVLRILKERRGLEKTVKDCGTLLFSLLCGAGMFGHIMGQDAFFWKHYRREDQRMERRKERQGKTCTKLFRTNKGKR